MSQWIFLFKEMSQTSLKQKKKVSELNVLESCPRAEEN